MIGEWLFGCDVCQDVCPWNEVFARPTDEPLAPRPALAVPDLDELVNPDAAEFDRAAVMTPLLNAPAAPAWCATRGRSERIGDRGGSQDHHRSIDRRARECASLRAPLVGAVFATGSAHRPLAPTTAPSSRTAYRHRRGGRHEQRPHARHPGHHRLQLPRRAGRLFSRWPADSERPLRSGWFLIGFAVYASTAFGWVFVMRHSLATISVVYSVSMILLLTAIGVVFFGERLPCTKSPAWAWPAAARAAGALLPRHRDVGSRAPSCSGRAAPAGGEALRLADLGAGGDAPRPARRRAREARRQARGELQRRLRGSTARLLGCGSPRANRNRPRRASRSRAVRPT